MKTKQTKIGEFWDWFRDVAGALAANVESPALMKELDDRVRQLDPELSWEIGPGISKSWQLVISPNLNRDLRDKARTIVSGAPVLAGWEFYSARQRKEWDYKLELESADGDELIRLDASDWTFVLLRYPDGAHEVLLKGKDLSLLTDDERQQAAAIALESALGEEMILDRIDEFELLDQFEPRFAERQRPIRQLRDAVLGK
jgi:hypothetical protein